MKRIATLIISSLLITSCSTAPAENSAATGTIPDCSKIERIASVTETFEMPCLDGSEIINFHSIRGPIVVNVWGSWCTGCREEMPYFVDLYATGVFKTGKIKLLGIDVQEKDLTSGQKFIKSHAMSWPHLIDVEDKGKFLFGPGVPVTWFIDKDGKVVETRIGSYNNKKQLYDQTFKAFGIKL
jgi:thiol-disulfide isomerase/thioredoxin